MPRPERIRGTVVHLLDSQKTTDFLKTKLNNETIKAQPMAVVNGENGIATLCTEGVGWFVDDNGVLPINYYAGEYGSGYLDITPEELMPLISNETIDLADFIRSFGDRLENNFYSWVGYARGWNQEIAVMA
jgi:hypothetical protein